MEIDVKFMEAALSKLAAKRPIFHSEADFQHSFAWTLKKIFDEEKKWEHYDVRLELPQNIGETYGHVDIVITKDATSETFIELKYKKKKCNVTHKGEDFNLKNASAPDYGCYQFIKDIKRIEELTENNSRNGFSIFLTNYEGYLKNGKNTQYADFSIYQGRTLKAGSLTGKINGKNVEPIKIRSSYTFYWKKWSHLSDKKNETFNYLIIPIKNNL